MANIHTAGRSGFIRRGGVRRRETLWLFLSEVNTVLVGGNAVVLQQSLNAAALALRPFTIVRTRINWFMKSDQTAALEIPQVALGGAVVSDQSVAIGVTAVPTPFTDLGSDLWFLHEILACSFTFVTGAGFDAIGGVWKDADSKAMRKVEDGQDIIFSMENSGNSLGSNNTTAGRMLIKLH